MVSIACVASLLLLTLTTYAQVTGPLEGNDELLRAMNAAIVRLDQTGRLATLMSTWFPNIFAATKTCSANPVFYPFPQQPRVGGTLDVVLSRRELRVGSELTFAPFQRVNGTAVVGFEVDLVTHILQQMSTFYGTQINARWIAIPWRSQKDELYRGTVDVLANGIRTIAETDNQLNANLFEFPCSIFAEQAAVLRGPLTIGVSLPNLAALNQTFVKIAVLNNTITSTWARMHWPAAQFMEYTTHAEALAAVIGSAVPAVTPTQHVYITETSVANYETVRHGNITEVSNFASFGPYTPLSMALRRDAFTISSLIPCGNSVCGGPTCK